MTQWQIAPRQGRRFLAGHPWVFANELNHSPKGLRPGSLIDLVGSRGEFLARGYGNPNSLIAFRTLTTQPGVEINESWLDQTLADAAQFRRTLGYSASQRLIFSEADGLPGIVIDWFRGPRGQAFAVQLNTAGAELLASELRLNEALLRFAAERYRLGESVWGTTETSLLIHRQGGFRAYEGLVDHEVAIQSPLDTAELQNFPIALSGPDQEPVKLFVDLIHGQKTGFFLDQRDNIHALLRAMKLQKSQPGSALRILDLCCYVGQWSTYAAAVKEGPIEATLVDSSKSALERAISNVEAAGGKAHGVLLDVVAPWEGLPYNEYDVIICDPPAFVKKSKDVPAGLKAYTKLNAQALRYLAPGGLYAACSCSGNVSESDFKGALAAAENKAKQRLRWFYQGGQAGDHPRFINFPEGQYLKCWIGQKSFEKPIS